MATTMTSTTTPTQSDYLSIVHAFKATNQSANEKSNSLANGQLPSSSPLMELSVVPSPIQFPILPGFVASRATNIFRDDVEEEEGEESIDNDHQEVYGDTKSQSASINDDGVVVIASSNENDVADESSRKGVVADIDTRPMQHADPNIDESSSSVQSSSSLARETEPNDGCRIQNESPKIQCKVESDNESAQPSPSSPPTIRTRPRGKILARIKREDVDLSESTDISVGGNEAQEGSSPQSQIGPLIHRSKTKPCDIFSHRGTANILHPGTFVPLFLSFLLEDVCHFTDESKPFLSSCDTCRK